MAFTLREKKEEREKEGEEGEGKEEDGKGQRGKRGMERGEDKRQGLLRTAQPACHRILPDVTGIVVEITGQHNQSLPVPV